MSGKGDTPRPIAVDAKTFSDNWDRIFRAKPDGSPNKVGKENESESIAAAEVTRAS